MSEKQGKLYEKINQAKPYVSMIDKAQAIEILEDAKADFPFKIYKDNDGFGENPKPVFSFYIKNPVDPDKSFPLEDLLDVESEIALWYQKWFGSFRTQNK